MCKRAFKNKNEFKQKFLEYISYCKEEKKLANIAGFCAFCDIVRDTFYAQKEYYSDTYEKINDILEDITINSKDITDTFKIFYMKNKFDYKDKQEVSANVKTQEIRVELND